MKTTMTIPSGKRIMTRLSYGIPNHFHSCERLFFTDRKWWQLWRPKSGVIYLTTEEQPNEKGEA